jgi:hypothetical protein
MLAAAPAGFECTLGGCPREFVEIDRAEFMRILRKDAGLLPGRPLALAKSGQTVREKLSEVPTVLKRVDCWDSARLWRLHFFQSLNFTARLPAARLRKLCQST